MVRPALQHREHRGDGLADAGGRLSEQAATAHRSAIYALRQRALAGAEFGMREAERVQRGFTRRGMGDLLSAPGQKAVAMGLEEGTQGAGLMGLDEGRLGLGRDLEIDQRHMHFSKLELAAQQPTVDLRLGPVQCSMIRRHALEGAAMGLHLFEPVRGAVVTVDAAAHREALVGARHADLGLVIHRPALRNDPMSGDSFLRGGRRREAKIEIALLGRELAERAHADDVAGRSRGVGHRRCRRRYSL